MKIIQLLIGFLILPIQLLAQTNELVYLTFSEYLNIVKAHHPVAYQAQLKDVQGEAYVKKAKGGFDPKLQGDVHQKYFDGKQYYSYIHGGLKVPTWFGVELQAGYDNNDGYYLNSESYTVASGIWSAGLSVNLGNGLLIDQRRADIQQARIIQQSTALEKKLMLNQLMHDAMMAYLNWNKAYDKVQLYQKNIENIEERYLNLLENVKYGDKAAVDTLKVKTQILDRKIKLNQAQLDYKNKSRLLNTFLWQDGLIPLEMDSNLIPKVDATIFNTDTLIDFSNQALYHPEVIMANNNISIAKIDYRLKKESLKPTVQIKYNALSSDLGNGVIADYSYENYKWGVNVSYPIFTRKERASIDLAEVKLEQNKAKLENKTAQIEYKMEATYNELKNMNVQLQLQNESVDMYQQLLSAEMILFDIGESSMFVVNTRDQNLIAAQIKYLEAYYQLKMTEVLMGYQLMVLE